MWVFVNVSRLFLLTHHENSKLNVNLRSKLQTEWEQLTGLPLDIRVLFLKLLFPFVQLLLEILKFLLVLVLLFFGNLFFWGRLYRKTQNTHSNTLTHIDTLTHTPIIMNKRNGVRGRHLWNKYGRFFVLIHTLIRVHECVGRKMHTRFCPGSVSLNSKNESTSWSSVERNVTIFSSYNFSATSNTNTF